MKFTDSIDMLIQTENGTFSTSGIQYFENEVTGIDPQLGLMVFSRSKNTGQHSAAYKSIEILMDDMLLNLNAKNSSARFSGTLASHCIHESLDNINDYFCFQGNSIDPLEAKQGIEIAVVQLEPKSISCCSIGQLQCLRFSADKIQEVGELAHNKQHLGLDTPLKVQLDEHGFDKDDSVLILSTTALKAIGKEFIRVTLSRFKENLSMILRQLNTRALQNGLKQKPTMIICHKTGNIEVKRSWIDKLLN